MKRFMYVSIGLLCLSLSTLIGFHIGSRTAQAQAAAPVVGFATTETGDEQLVIDTNGGVWLQRRYNLGATATLCGDIMGFPTYCGDAPLYIGNFWGSGTVSSGQSSLGAVKSRLGGNK